MKVYYQSGHDLDRSLTCYQVKNTIHKIIINTSLEEELFQCRKQSDSVFLLNESYFHLLADTIEGEFFEVFDIEMLEAIVADSVRKMKKKKGLSGKLLLYDIDHITIDGKESAYLLGNTGMIRFQLSLIIIKQSLINACPMIMDKHTGPKIYPASYFTLQFIVHSLKKTNFSIISLSSKKARLITINQGRYNTIESINRGYEHIKEICSKNNILSYFHKTDSELESNPMAYEIMKKTLNFYNKMLVDRIASFSEDHPDAIMIAPRLKQKVFWDSFYSFYKDKINGYVLPFSVTNQLSTYGKEWKSQELDVLTCLNLYDKKGLVG